MRRQREARTAGRLLGLLLVLLALSSCRLIEAPQARIAVGFEKPLAVGSMSTPFVVQVDREFLYEATVPWPEDIVQYHWDFGDGTVRVFRDEDLLEGAAGSYRYPHVGEGTYALRLTVTTRKAQSYVAQIQVRVEPVLWICDPSTNDVRKVGLDGRLIVAWSLPLEEPRGIALAEEEDGTWLYVACANRGRSGIVRLNAESGALDPEFGGRGSYEGDGTAPAPGLDPRDLCSADLGDIGRTLWHIDAGTHFLYLLSARNAYLLERYDRDRMISPGSPAIEGDFLRRPLGLDYAVTVGREKLWYAEGEPDGQGAVLYSILIGRRQGIVWGVDLQIEAHPARIDDASLFPISGLVALEDEIWVVSRSRNAVVAIDPATGRFVRDVVSALPSPASAFDVQR